ncbi:tripartite tricarboxylate transporter substrate binding protein [Pigmentiphaga soli]
MTINRFGRALRAACLCLPAAGLSGAAGAAGAAGAYPDRPVRIVVPFAAGGPADILGRLVAAGLADRLHGTFVVENKAGGGGNIGTAQVARADADGYTLVIGYIGPFGINPSLYKKQSFDPVKDFAPVSLLATSPLVLVTRPGLGAGSVAELVKLARSRSMALTYGSGGVGSANHLAGELFKTATGVDLVHVPYQGIAPATTDLLGGQVDLMFNGISSVLQYVKAGKLPALAVTTAARVDSLPDVPTMEEAGVKPFDVSAWFGLLAPRGTPPAVLASLEAAVRDTMNSPEASARLAATGMQRRLMPQAEFGRFIESEVKLWSGVVRASGASAD